MGINTTGVTRKLVTAAFGLMALSGAASLAAGAAHSGSGAPDQQANGHGVSAHTVQNLAGPIFPTL